MAQTSRQIISKIKPYSKRSMDINKKKPSMSNWLKISVFTRKSLMLGVSILAGIVLLMIFYQVGIKIYNNYTNKTVNIISLKSYKSTSVRDPNKVEQDEFSRTDPIQAIFEFKKAKYGTVVDFYLIYEDKEESEIMRVQIPLSSESNEIGERTVNISPSSINLENGTYTMYIEQNEYVMKSSSFTIN